MRLRFESFLPPPASRIPPKQSAHPGGSINFRKKIEAGNISARALQMQASRRLLFLRRFRLGGCGDLVTDAEHPENLSILADPRRLQGFDIDFAAIRISQPLLVAAGFTGFEHRLVVGLK